ncbi:sigma-54-dependent transcriptional regulator [Desulfocurvibacter africanus]|uniref:sigma-54-dependent transcriptional regulator n=1 Tax=Desulfocurvibacter africanus TaxID=873 RepID=UPI00041BB23D|nr:sigma-54 dependent transcriptional regulator [Desulfocurvibacter africanus]
MANVLVIDDDEAICSLLAFGLGRAGHTVECARTLERGLTLLEHKDFSVALLDVLMPDGNGLDILPRIRKAPSAPEVIIITGAGVSGAELAIKNGAWDYVQKPFSLKEVTLPLVRALEYRQEKARASQPQVIFNRDRIIGSSPKFVECLNLMAMAATTDSTVLIQGETGTGKELFARAIHDNSARKSRDFIVVDCAALPSTLIESVLFGHRKGSFTGADKTTDGLIKAADSGTLFLDEVGELPLEAQKSFLRILQEKSFRPIGSQTEVRSDFRLLAATNRDLEAMSEEGTFRKDLLFRLRSLTIELPPMRNRLEDIKELTLYHTSRLCERFGLGTKAVSPEFFEYMTAYAWPGNVRELVNTLEGAITVARFDHTLLPPHLPQHIRVYFAKISDAKPRTEGFREVDRPSPNPDSFPTLKEYRRDAIAEVERAYLVKLMEHAQGDFRKACDVSGVSRSRLYDLLKSHKVDF